MARTNTNIDTEHNEAPSHGGEDVLMSEDSAIRLEEASHEPTIDPSACPTLNGQAIADPAPEPLEVPPRARDFGFLPIPESRRYRPERTFPFTLTLNIIFGFASTASELANVASRGQSTNDLMRELLSLQLRQICIIASRC